MWTRRELAIFILAFVATVPAVTPRFYASDEVQYYAWLRSAAFDRDVDFDNEYRHFHATVIPTNLFYDTFLSDERRTEAGRRANYAPVGCAILWAPFFAVGHAAALATGAPADGYSQPYITAVSLGSAVYGALAIWISALIARRVVGRGLAASLLVALGTPLVFYLYIAPPFAHATSAFTVSLFLWIWLRVRDTWTPGGALALGLAGGLMASVREQDVFFAVGPALDFLLRSRARGIGMPHFAVPLLTGLAGFLVALAPQLLAYRALNGHFGPTHTVTRKMSWTSPHALGVIASPEHGLFFWTPLALVALAGLLGLALWWAPRSTRDVRWLATLAALMFGLQVYISGAVESWTVAGSFGQRRFVATTPLLVLGLAAWQTRLTGRWARRALWLGCATCLWWNLALLALFGTHRMDRQRLTLGANLRAAFIELPLEAPALAWRYLTDRSSFYRQPRG